MCPSNNNDQASAQVCTLEPGNILGRGTPKNTEMLCRAGFGIAFAVTAMRWGNQTAAAVAASPATAAAAKFKEAVDAQKHAKAFLQALQVLDVGKAGSISQDKAEDALKTYVKFLEHSDNTLQDALVKLVVESGQLYLAAIHMLEQKAFVTKAGGWAKKMRRSGIPEELKAWSNNATDRKKLVEGLAKLYRMKCKQMSMTRLAARRRKARFRMHQRLGAAPVRRPKAVQKPRSNVLTERRKKRKKRGFASRRKKEAPEEFQPVKGVLEQRQENKKGLQELF